MAQKWDPDVRAPEKLTTFFFFDSINLSSSSSPPFCRMSVCSANNLELQRKIQRLEATNKSVRKPAITNYFIDGFITCSNKMHLSIVWSAKDTRVIDCDKTRISFLLHQQVTE